ncbi:single-stranded DNA-binding protein [Amnibacterium flavum]|uniref:Single-stranded DNA-binding protein n=1 Tax=Amnibacterium flavum TaxID=2173173 RepID=A0A2V1HNJ1_9MICO|nr:single-stranded DNA-binding protein [Amnibacterium flavum]PVZ93971.1 single-stranded DNA-binding protein [Amnibacterium flavum]
MSDHITVVGRVATVPKRIERGEAPALVTFRLASRDSRFDEETKTWIESDPNWYTVNAWRALADNVERSVRKGQPVIVTGRLDLRTWKDDSGANRVDPTLQADGIGHDLRRGSSTFTGTASRSAAASVSLDASPSSGAEAEWHVPLDESADLPF